MPGGGGRRLPTGFEQVSRLTSNKKAMATFTGTKACVGDELMEQHTGPLVSSSPAAPVTLQEIEGTKADGEAISKAGAGACKWKQWLREHFRFLDF